MIVEKECVPCRGGVEMLTPERVQELLATVPGWFLAMEGKAICRRFTFKNFAKPLALVNQVASIAEAEGHHPDIRLGWGYAEFLLWTHSIGGLHENDFIIARKINALHD